LNKTSYHFSVDVTIPITALPGESDNATILAASVGNPALYNDTIQLDTMVSMQDTLQVKAEIDGHTQLIVQGECLHWFHLEYAAPGRETGEDKPTYVNGVAWYPFWPDEPNRRNDSCECNSSGYGPVPGLRPIVQTVSMEILAYRDNVSITQQPAASNEFTLVVDFDDTDTGGSDWYEIRLTYETYTSEKILLPVIRR
jgi:hypothetical protein